MPEGLPYTWKTKMLGTICQLSGGYGFPDSFQGSVEGELPFIKISDMSLPGNERDIVNANNYVSMRIANSMGWKPFPASAVVFAKVGAALKLNRRRILIKPTLIDNNMMAAIPQGGFDSAFLYHFLCVIDFGDFVQDGALPSVNQEQVGSIKLPDINKDEQRRIAEILDTIDEAIQKTEALISKLKAMKQGLLYDLLTRGLDKNGKLRDPKTHPEQFKDSQLGKIPKGWVIQELGKAATKIQDGTHFSPKTTRGPFRYLTSKNIRFGHVDLSDCGWISEKEHEAIYSRCDVRYGDVLLTKDGANTGNAAINNLNEPVSLLSSVAFIRCDDRTLHSEYLFHYLLSPGCQQRIKDLMSGNAITRLTLEKIKSFVIPVPDIKEQLKIIEPLNSHDARIRAEEQYRDKLKLQKNGLMHDLLTGKVRVKV